MGPTQEPVVGESNNSSTRNKHGLLRKIPESTMREVRQRCGFGCVICGLGLYEYEHFAPEFVDAERHDPNGITLLCPNHHAKKTKKTLSLNTVKQANDNPKAIEQKFANERFDLVTNSPIVILGTAVFKNTPIILMIEDEPILHIEPGVDENEPFLLTASLKDKMGASILEIERNEWKTNTDNWDCKAEGNRIEIRSAPGNIELVLRQEPPTTIVIERLTMLHRGHTITAQEGKKTQIISPNGRIFNATDCSVSDCSIGFMLLPSGIGVGFGGGSVSFSGYTGQV